MVNTDWSALKAGALGSFGVKLGNVLLGFLLSLVLARNLGVAELGTYSYVMSWVLLISAFTKMGFAELLLREVSRYEVSGEFGYIRGIHKFSTLLVLSVSLITITLIFLIIQGWYRTEHETSIWSAFLVGLLLVPIVSLSSLRQATLRAWRKILWGQIPENIVKPLILIVLILTFSLCGAVELNAESALWLNFIVSIAIFLMMYFLLNRVLPKRAKESLPAFESSRWVHSASQFLVIAGLLVVNGQADRLMLGGMGYISQVGVYTVVVQIASFTAYPLVAMLAALTPLIVRLAKNNELLDLQVLIARAMKWVIAAAVLIAALTAIGAGHLLAVFGEGFESGASVLYVLLIGQLFNALAGPSGMVLNMMGSENWVIRGVAVSTIVNILLNYFLIPRFGLEGAAFATTISLLLWNGLLGIFVWRSHKIISTPLIFFGKYRVE